MEPTYEGHSRCADSESSAGISPESSRDIRNCLVNYKNSPTSTKIDIFILEEGRWLSFALYPEGYSFSPDQFILMMEVKAYRIRQKLDSVHPKKIFYLLMEHSSLGQSLVSYVSGYSNRKIPLLKYQTLFLSTWEFWVFPSTFECSSYSCYILNK